ncbi:hypothetical protein FB45DRAFT_911432 [Roridomyces roridus]|uniref:Uncharacterized protein n=1 Tax=Roridomyces roridus TaxID=1738132 RepID=A0AAD7C241_9AGAR|nr:hypothetical protein FB45DRAFT_911432 [Roridomyces roridus]
MAIRLPAEDSDNYEAKCSSRSCFSWLFGSLVATLVSLLRGLWTTDVPRYELVDCEKEPQHVYETQAHLLASLKRRNAADAAFQAQIMALLAPVKMQLAELSHSFPDPHLDHSSDLPPPPQMFFGRDDELDTLCHLLSPERPYPCTLHAQAVALTGPVGMGKSALALAFIHFPQTLRRFGSQRFLLRGDTEGMTGVLRSLAGALQLHPQLPAHALQPTVLAALEASSDDCLIVLDDLDEARVLQPTLGAFLARLCALPRVYLLLVLPGSTAVPDFATAIMLSSLALPAARGLFRAIADLPPNSSPSDTDTDEAVDALLLQHAGCVPRAVVALAQQAQYEPLPLLLARCAEEEGGAV